MGRGATARIGTPSHTGEVVDMLIPSKRWRHFAAMALIGDGVMAVIRPERDADAWEMGPRAWRQLMRRLQRNPTLTRAVGAAQVLGGIWWALYQEKDE